MSEGVQVSEAVPVEGGGHVTNSVAAQTVMTLCNCSYVPDARMLATVHHGATGGQVVISRATVEDIDREVFAETVGQAAEQPGRAREVGGVVGTDAKQDVRICPKEETRKDVEGVATGGREEEGEGGEEEGDVGENSPRKTVVERMVQMVDEAIQTDVSSAESDQQEMVKCTQDEQEKMDSASEVETAKATAEIKMPLADDHDEVKCLGETGVRATAVVVSDIKATNSPQGEVSTTSKVASGLSALAEKITEKTGKLVKKKSIDAATDGKINLPLLNAGLTAAVPNQGILATHTDTQLSHAAVLEEPTTKSAVATEPVIQTTKTAATEAVLQKLDTVTHQAEVMMKEAADQKTPVNKTVDDTEHETSTVVTKQPVVVDETVVCDVIDTTLCAVESVAETQSADEVKPVAAPVRDDINRFDVMDIVSDPGVGERRLRPAHRANSEPHLLRLRQPKRPNLDELFCPDSEAPAAQPPASPMIRSKYPRRMRLSDLKVEQLYPDSNTWKATPPRRMIRHRKQSTEKPAMSSGPASPTGTESFGEMTNVRQRTNSDGSLMRPKSLQLMPTHAGDGSMGFVPIGRGSGRRPNLPVFDVLGVNEPFSRDHMYRRSPGPSLHKPKMSPVRRLKSAVELMADSARTRRTRSASTSRLGRSSPSHSFSFSGSKVDDRSHRSARQSRKDAPSHSSSEDLSEPQATTDTTSHRLSLPTEQMQSRHKLSRESLVSQGQVRKLTETFTSGRENTRAPQGRGLRGRDVPHQGTVAERTDIFKKRLSSSSVESDVSVLFPRRRGVSLDRHRRREPVDQSDRGRPRLVVWTPSKSGAVSSLCKHAMLVDVQEGKKVTEDSCTVPATRRRSQQSEGRRGSDDSSQTRSEGDRKKSHKFLEGAWLQKPKRFFKVSK